ncbi:MAG: carboxypeptidase regulatory-like domain-containing protein [Betaproteobacteria bacterium]|nr:carboxypeptidase regulatory-like domain-containing protein [Betaproteobacteria bacterium]
MSTYSFVRIRIIIAMVVTMLLATACGGGGGDSAVAGVGSGGTGYISGTVTKGPVGNGTMAGFAISNGQMGAQIGTATTGANGNFTMSIGAHAGAVMLQVSGGSYVDEATGATMAMASGDVMTAIMPPVAAGANSTGIQVTPVTAMAQTLAHRMAGGMTDANIATANTAMGNYFSVNDILHVPPINTLVAGSGAGASQDAQNYGMTLAAMSKYAQTLGLNSTSAMVTALMNDASDGMMDGKAGSAPVQMGGMGGMAGGMMPSNAGTTGMGAAMNAFMNSAQNRSGIMTAALVNKLNGSGGQILSGMPPVSNATVSGTVFNGPVSNATVVALAINNGAMGAQIASVTTDSQGNFSLSLGTYTGPVMLQMSGASYIDAATQTTMMMAANEFMSALLPTVASGANVTGIWITPLTAMAQSRALGMSGGMTDANIVAANMAMGNYFLVNDILHTRPMNPTVSGSGAGASQDQRNYGMALAAMSQYAKSFNMSVSSSLCTAMMNDAFDGVMDGKKGTTQISMSMGGMMGTSMMQANAGTSGLATAMTGFMNSAANMSGLTIADMAALMQRLNGSNGHI